MEQSSVSAWCFVLACRLGCVSEGGAVTFRHGGVNHDWSTAGNGTAGEPRSTDAAYVGISTAEVTVANAAEFCRDPHLGFEAGTTGSLAITSGDLAVGNYFCRGNSGYGEVNCAGIGRR